MTTLVKILVVIILNSTGVSSQNVVTNDITVHISGLKNSKGKLLVGLYNTEASFLDKPYKSSIVSINEEKSTLTFKNIPNGVYAISFVHDKNDNGKMDTNFMGIPKESYGCSNNAKGFMGPPKWEDAKFELKAENKTINISL